MQDTNPFSLYQMLHLSTSHLTSDLQTIRDITNDAHRTHLKICFFSEHRGKSTNAVLHCQVEWTLLYMVKLKHSTEGTDSYRVTFWS